MPAAEPARSCESALVLIAHGSRDPAWSAPLEAMAAGLQARLPEITVRLAFLEYTVPDPAHVLTELSRTGCRRASIAPLFLGIGAHARADIDAIVTRVSESCPDLALTVLPVLGEMAQVQASLVGILANVLDTCGKMTGTSSTGVGDDCPLAGNTPS